MLDFESIQKEYGDKLLRRATMLCYGNQTFAEEAVQETLVAAWKHQEQFKGGKVLAWLFTILRNKVIDARRPSRAKSFLHNSINLDDDGAMKEGFKALSVMPEEPEKVDIQEVVKKAIASLPEGYSNILRMRLMDEMSQKDIAKSLNMPLGTVMTRTFRIMDTLRERVAEQLVR